LLAAEGLPNAEITRRVGVGRQTVISWRGRYSRRAAALEDLTRSGRPPVHDEVAVVVATLRSRVIPAPPPPPLRTRGLRRPGAASSTGSDTTSSATSERGHDGEEELALAGRGVCDT
jgi:hypothetical protein